MHIIGYAGRSNRALRIEPRACRYLGHSQNHTIATIERFSAKSYPGIYTQPSIQGGIQRRSGAAWQACGRAIGLHSAIERDVNLARGLNVSGEVAVSVRFDMLRGALAAANVPL